jgi:hypothetical protein
MQWGYVERAFRIAMQRDPRSLLESSGGFRAAAWANAAVTVERNGARQRKDHRMIPAPILPIVADIYTNARESEEVAHG